MLATRFILKWKLRSNWNKQYYPFALKSWGTT